MISIRMKFYITLSICVLIAMELSHSQVQAESSPDCKLEEFKCGTAFRGNIAQIKGSPEHLCREINSFLQCLLSMNCSKSEDDDEEFIKGARDYVSRKAPGCVLTVDEIEQTSPSTIHVTNDETDCTAQLKKCGTSGFSQLMKSEQQTCDIAKDYLSCVYGLQCLEAKDARQGVLQQTQTFLQFASPLCNVTEHVQQLLSKENGTTETSQNPMMYSTADTDCVSQLQICKETYKNNEIQLTDATTACSNAKEYLSCVYGLSCDEARSERGQTSQHTKSRLVYSSPDCNITDHEQDLLEQEKQNEMTTVEVFTTEMDCETQLRMCIDAYEDTGSQLMDDNTTCGNAKDYMTCVYSLPCPSAQAQRGQASEHVKSFMEYLRLSDCNITGHEADLLQLYPDAEVTDTSPPLTSIAAQISEITWPMDTETRTSESADMTSVNSTEMATERQTTDMTTEQQTSESADMTTGIQTTESTDLTSESLTTGYTDMTTRETTAINTETQASTTMFSMTSEDVIDSTCRQDISSCIFKMRYDAMQYLALPTILRTGECCTLISRFDRCARKARCSLNQLFESYRVLKDVPEISQFCAPLGLIATGPGMSPCPGLGDLMTSPGVTNTGVSANMAGMTNVDPQHISLGIHGITVEIGSNTQTSGTHSTQDMTSSFFDGTGTSMAPSSTNVPVDSFMNLKVINLNAELIGGTQVMVTWKLSVRPKPDELTGFVIMYKIVSDSKYQLQNLDSTDEERGEFHAVLNLEQSKKHAIKIKPYSEKLMGKACHPLYIFVSGQPLSLTPALSLSARPLAADTVMLSYSAVGSDTVTNPMFYFMRDSKKQWTPALKQMIAFNDSESIVLTGLREASTYNFLVKATLGANEHTAVVSVMTPSSETAPPLTLSKLNENGSVYVDWSNWILTDVQGYRLTVQYNLQGALKSDTKVHYLPGATTRFRVGDTSESVDKVKVEPFDSNGIRPGAELDCVMC